MFSKTTCRSSVHGSTEVELQRTQQMIQELEVSEEVDEEAISDEAGNTRIESTTTSTNLFPLTLSSSLTQRSTINLTNSAIEGSSIWMDPHPTTTKGIVIQEQEVVDADGDEECPICCDVMSIADVRYPLHCPTPSCSYNYCSSCMERFIQAASDGYEEASDGSRQVRVTVKCPCCRSKYSTKSCPYSSEVIVNAILTLRSATLMQAILDLPDSDLKASDLLKRQNFVACSSMEDLEDSFMRVQVYQSSFLSIDDNCCNSNKLLSGSDDKANVLRVKPLDWRLLRKFLRPTRVNACSNPNAPSSTRTIDGAVVGSNRDFRTSSQSLSRLVTTSTTELVWKDPTLFGGMEELMTVSEHEFLTCMLTSGQSEAVAQAAAILHGVMNMSTSQRTTRVAQHMQGSATSVAATSTTETSSPQSHQHHPLTSTAVAASRPVRLSPKCIEHIYRIKKRYALPVHMPRCISIPVYDPVNGTHRDRVLEFVKDKTFSNTTSSAKAYTLTLNSVSGIAGRIGLRKGDTVTHVDGNTVDTYEEFVVAMQQQLLCQQHSVVTTDSHGSPATTTAPITYTVQIIVNATQEIAIALQKRAKDMQSDGIKFNY